MALPMAAYVRVSTTDQHPEVLNYKNSGRMQHAATCDSWSMLTRASLVGRIVARHLIQ